MFKRLGSRSDPARPALYDAQALQRDGFQVLRNVISEGDQAELRAIYQRMLRLVAEGKITRTAVHTAGDHAELFDRIDEMQPVRDLARSIVGEDYCRLVSRFLIKDKAYNGPIPAHQDYPYFGGSPDKLNIFVPLTRCAMSNGMMTFLKGSHRYGPLERGVIDIDRYPQLERVPLDLDVGDLLIADFLTWHYSDPAQETGDRVMVQIVYQPSTDPSSKYLVNGRILNDAECANRSEPLASRETDINFQNASVMFQHGHDASAERIALDVLSTDAENVRVLLLLKQIYRRRGDAEREAEYAARAKAAAQAVMQACAAECG